MLKKYLQLSIVVALLILNINIINAYKYESNKEENNPGLAYLKAKGTGSASDSGKLNKINEKEDSSSPDLKSFSNKEFVYGEESDDFSNSEKLSKNANAIAFESNKMNENQFMPNENAEIEIDANKLKRTQRIDKKFPLSNDFDFDMSRLALIQKKLLSNEDSKIKLNSLIMTKLEKQDIFDDEIGDEVNLEGQIDGDVMDKFAKSPMFNHKAMKNFLNDLNMLTVNQKETKLTKPKVGFKEKSFLEKEYFDQLKQSTPKNGFFNQGDSLELLKTFEDMEGEGSFQKQQSELLNSQPTYKLKSGFVDSNQNIDSKFDFIRKQNDYLFIFIVIGCSIAGVIAIIAASVCWYTVHKNNKSSSGSNAEFGASKVGLFNSSSGNSSGSIKSKISNSSGDKKLAQSAQMYHYQHQKQQMIAMEKANNDQKLEDSDNSEGETEEGDYTVYECPGLAPTGEMEVKNPLFKEDFGASSNNLASSASNLSGQPPAYSSVVTVTPVEQKALKNIKPVSDSNEQSKKPSEDLTLKSDQILISINETKENK